MTCLSSVPIDLYRRLRSLLADTGTGSLSLGAVQSGEYSRSLLTNEARDVTHHVELSHSLTPTYTARYGLRSLWAPAARVSRLRRRLRVRRPSLARTDSQTHRLADSRVGRAVPAVTSLEPGTTPGSRLVRRN